MPEKRTIIERVRRWWRERRDPTLRCKRVGHSAVKQKRYGFTKPEELFSRFVAMDIKQERLVCARCQAELTEWRTVRRKGLTGLTLDEDLMDELDSNREVWLR